MTTKEMRRFKKRYSRHLKLLATIPGKRQPYLEKFKCYRPDPAQTAWVISIILKVLETECSFRYMIYNLMGYGFDAYSIIYLAGGMTITNREFE